MKQLVEAEARLVATFAVDHHFTFLPLSSQATSTEQVSPSNQRQSMTLLRARPFNWLQPILTSFTSRNIGPRVFPNDFLLRVNQIGEAIESNPLNVALINVAAILADRRSHMLAQGLGQRTYNVFLPPAIIMEIAAPRHTYILVPSLSFIRLPNRNYFRRTFSLSVVIIPVSENEHWPRSFDSDELAALQSGWTLIPKRGIASYSLREGDLSGFMSMSGHSPSHRGQGPVALRELVQDLLFSVAHNSIVTRPDKGKEAVSSQICDLAVRAVQASLCGGCCWMMPDVAISELRNWQASPAVESDIERKLNEAIVRLMGPEQTHQWAMAQASAFRLRHGRGAESLIPTFYFSFGLQRLLFTPCGADLESCDDSILWVVGWHLLLMTGISALLEMLSTFHHEMERRPTAVSAQAFLKEFILDLEEYFDFELLPAYRLDFDALKNIEGIDGDFERLQERVSALSQDLIIEAGRKINLRLLWIAVGTLMVSIALLMKEFAPMIVRQPTAQGASRADAAESHADAAMVAVSSNPENADVLVDNTFVGNTPSTIRLQPGQHTIRVSLSGFREWSKDVSVFSGSDLKLVALLQKQRQTGVPRRETK